MAKRKENVLCKQSRLDITSTLDACPSGLHMHMIMPSYVRKQVSLTWARQTRPRRERKIVRLSLGQVPQPKMPAPKRVSRNPHGVSVFISNKLFIILCAQKHSSRIKVDMARHVSTQSVTPLKPKNETTTLLLLARKKTKEFF